MKPRKGFQMSGVRQTLPDYAEASTFSHPESSQAARLLSLSSRYKSKDRTARTADTCKVADQRLLDQVDTVQVLPVAERKRSARRARTEFHRNIGTKGAAARKVKLGIAA